MCFCDGLDFLIVNKTNGEKHLIQGNENLVGFFEGHYSLPCLFHRLLKKEYVCHNTSLYLISYNSHPECQRIKMGLVKTLGIEDCELWKCPTEHIHLLDEEKNNKHSLDNNILI